MNSIEKELQTIRMEKFFKDMDNVYKQLDKIVQDEMDTSLEQFLVDYCELKKSLSTIS